jgi:N-acetylglucosaminyldiphosphoundecaprenol N-acetyl-beta-D-mannosaminyltransferase
MGAVVDRGREWGLRHYLFGATPETLARLQGELERRYPGAEIVGAESPPFRPLSDAELDGTVDRIWEAKAEAVWVGLGAPKQDLVGARLRERNAAPAIFCVGAAFDFVSGVKRRAPEWMQRSGLEWAHRLGSEPTRLWKRYLVGNARFLGDVAADRIREAASTRRV